jgi:hypothetical protein
MSISSASSANQAEQADACPRQASDRHLLPGRNHQRQQVWRGCAQTVSNRGRAQSKRLKERQAMKLNSTQLERTLSQFSAEVLPDDHPALKQLSNIYGDHTFFLDGSGLNVLEPAETTESDAQTGEVVSLANWSDATLTSLRPHEPEPTGVLVVLEQKH